MCSKHWDPRAVSTTTPKNATLLHLSSTVLNVQTTFHLFPGGSHYCRFSATSRPRCRLHEHTVSHATRFPSLFPFCSVLCLFALRFHRVPIHTGNQAFFSRFSPNSTCTRPFRYYAPLPTHSDLCSSADRCSGNRMHSYQHRTPRHNTFPSFDPNTRHAWHASHPEPTSTRLG